MLRLAPLYDPYHSYCLSCGYCYCYEARLNAFQVRSYLAFFAEVARDSATLPKGTRNRLEDLFLHSLYLTRYVFNARGSGNTEKTLTDAEFAIHLYMWDKSLAALTQTAGALRCPPGYIGQVDKGPTWCTLSSSAAQCSPLQCCPKSVLFIFVGTSLHRYGIYCLG